MDPNPGWRFFRSQAAGCIASRVFRTNGMFYDFAEVADGAFQRFDQIQEILENRRCNTSLWRLRSSKSEMRLESPAILSKKRASCAQHLHRTARSRLR